MYKKVSLWLLVVWAMLAIPFARADVQDVDFRFCDDTGGTTFLEWKKNFIVSPGQEAEICMNFSTTSETPRKVTYGFSKWLLDPSGIQICDSDKWPSNDFSKYIINTEERSFIIQKDQPKTIKEKVMLPIGMSGIQYGCIAYSLSAFEWSWLGGMFNLVINKVFPISLFVGNAADIKNDLVLLKNSWGAYTTNNQIKATMDAENNLTLNFLVKNQGNIGQNVEITGKIYNMLGFEKTFAVTLNNVAPSTQQDATTNIGIVPFYKWFFTVKYTVKYTPKFEFDASSLSDDVKKGGTIVWSAQIYMFSWITLAIILIALAIIIKLFWPKKKAAPVVVA